MKNKKENKLIPVTYHMSKQQINDLKVLAEKQSLSVASLIRISINEYLKKEKKDA